MYVYDSNQGRREKRRSMFINHQIGVWTLFIATQAKNVVK